MIEFRHWCFSGSGTMTLPVGDGLVDAVSLTRLGWRRLFRFSEQIVVARGVLPALPVADKLQTCGFGHGDELFRGGPERDRRPAVDESGLARQLAVCHSAHHSEPGSKAVFAVEVGEQFPASRELGSGIVLFLVGDFSQENAGARLCDALDFM